MKLWNFSFLLVPIPGGILKGQPLVICRFNLLIADMVSLFKMNLLSELLTSLHFVTNASIFLMITSGEGVLHVLLCLLSPACRKTRRKYVHTSEIGHFFWALVLLSSELHEKHLVLRLFLVQRWIYFISQFTTVINMNSGNGSVLLLTSSK